MKTVTDAALEAAYEAWKAADYALRKWDRGDEWEVSDLRIAYKKLAERALTEEEEEDDD